MISKGSPRRSALNAIGPAVMILWAAMPSAAILMHVRSLGFHVTAHRGTVKLHAIPLRGRSAPPTVPRLTEERRVI